jgi:hypothetical protein
MVAVTRDQVNVDDSDKVQIDNNELADLVARDKSKAAQELSSGTTIDPDHLTVDEHGKVIVSNATFQAQVRHFLSTNILQICINIHGCN